MILVDDRVGSKDLVKPLKETGLPADISRLEFGDAAFVGKGERNSSLDIGVELKTIGDLVGSLRSGRLAGHQLPGLLRTYDRTWLVVEGLWRHNDVGQLVTYHGKFKGWVPLRGGMTAAELEKQVLTLELCGGLHVRYTSSRRDTVRFLGSLYHWWTDSALDRHTSHLAVHRPATFIPISPFRQTVASFPGIGLKTSLAVEVYFSGSLTAAVNAPVAEWANITLFDGDGKSRRLGIAVATKIVAFCKGDNYGH